MWKNWPERHLWNSAEEQRNTLSVDQNLDDLEKNIRNLRMWKKWTKWFDYVITRGNDYKLSFYDEILNIPIYSWEALINLAKLVKELIELKERICPSCYFSSDKGLLGTNAKADMIKIESINWFKVIWDWQKLEQALWINMTQEEKNEKIKNLVEFLNKIPNAIIKERDRLLDLNNNLKY